jgi:GDP-mannose 6-dehydrogenase
MNISIFGLGYVGAVSLACLARDGHKVIGVDIDSSKLDLIRAGRSPVIEADMPALMDEVVRSGRVVVTDDAGFAVHNSDVSFICVGTPSRSNGSQDLKALERLTAQLGAALGSKAGYHVFVVRSTVTPGTVETVLVPLLERHSGKTLGRDFGVCFQPEFLREGSSIRDFDSPPFTVAGGDSDRAVAVVREIFARVPGGLIVCSIRTAEMLKYACNVFHALKITFANEIGRICQALEIDSHEVMDLVCQDTRLNIAPTYLRPGFAYGGSCLPKDLRALCHLADRRDVAIPMLSAVARSNELHIDHAVNLVLESGRRSVGMIGLSFKSGTDDLRESPLVVMAERFIGKGLKLKIYDPEVSLSRLVGANRRYIEETIPHIASLMCEQLAPVIDESEVLVVGLRTDRVVGELQARGRADQLVLDLVRLPIGVAVRGTYRGVCW